MNLPSPIAYPAAPHPRSHGPQGYKGYSDFKLFLRDEFVFRCVYCLDRERWYPNRDGSFSVDHFVPKSIEPGRETDYDNLVYACVRCNSNKQATVVGLDPTMAAFGDHFRTDDGGRIEGLSPEAADLIDHLNLNDGPALATRRAALAILRLKGRYPADEDVHAIYVTHFGFPDDLPDLSRLRPPGGNARPEGIANSHFERKKRGELPEVYWAAAHDPRGRTSSTALSSASSRPSASPFSVRATGTDGRMPTACRRLPSARVTF